MLPILGYLEQGAASSLIRALTEVGCFKPKFPYMSVRRSALYFIAMHLKGLFVVLPLFLGNFVILLEACLVLSV